MVNNYANLLHISNSITLWLGISPPDLFFYAVRTCCTPAGTACHADLALGGLTASAAAACPPHTSRCAAHLAAAAPAATAAPCNSATLLVAAAPHQPNRAANGSHHHANQLPPSSPAAVPAAPAGGHRHSNRLLHVLKGGREAAAAAGSGSAGGSDTRHALPAATLTAGSRLIRFCWGRSVSRGRGILVQGQLSCTCPAMPTAAALPLSAEPCSCGCTAC